MWVKGRGEEGRGTAARVLLGPTWGAMQTRLTKRGAVRRNPRKCAGSPMIERRTPGTANATFETAAWSITNKQFVTCE